MSDLHYICAEEAIETAHEKCKSGVISTQFFKRLASILRDLKRADVEPVVRGEWVEFDEDMNAYICSICREPYVLIDGTPEQNHYNYCPNCGAHMSVERSGSGE